MYRACMYACVVCMYVPVRISEEISCEGGKILWNNAIQFRRFSRTAYSFEIVTQSPKLNLKK